MNPAWFSFARRNGAEQAIPRAWSIGRSTLDAIPECLKTWYLSFFTAASLTEGSAPRQHEYECSSAELHRRFLMKVYPVKGAGGRGFIIVNSLRFEIPHVKMDRVTMPPAAQAYTDETELMTQCVNCRRIQSQAEPSSWHWIPEWVREVPPNIRPHFVPPAASAFRSIVLAKLESGDPWTRRCSARSEQAIEIALDLIEKFFLERLEQKPERHMEPDFGIGHVHFTIHAPSDESAGNRRAIRC